MKILIKNIIKLYKVSIFIKYIKGHKIITNKHKEKK